MNIYILNANLNMVGILDEYSSIIWTTRYYTNGEFELYMGAKAELLDKLKVGYFLVREQDVAADDEFNNVMMIQNREIRTDAEQGDTITITGPCIKSILNRRVIINQTNLNDTVAASIATLVTDNIINPTDTARKISNFILGTNSLRNSYNLKMQVTGKQLGDTIMEICQTYGYGYDIKIKNGKFVFNLYEGLDRSYDQNTNPFVVFSQEFDNLITCDYKEERNNYANVAIVAGEGEGTARKKQTVGTASGIFRREIWVDARNDSSNGGQIDPSDYEDILKEDGLQALKEHEITTSFEGEVNFRVNYEMGIDYKLGDVVQIENDYGVTAKTRIIEIIESEDENGITLVPTFSEMEVN